MTHEMENMVASGAGAAVSGTSAVGGVILGGSTTALSGAGITSGLAAVGSIVGGGMLAGVCVVAAAPIAGAAVGIAGYKLYKYLKARN